MSTLESIVLGIIQGLTEFIPISSSGHLVIAQTLFSGASDHLFLEFINFGTLLALLVFFRAKIVMIIRDILSNKNYRLAINILMTSVPAGVVGFVLSDFIASNLFFGSVITVAVTLAVVGIVMIVLERLPKASPVSSGEKLPVKRAFVIGLAQMLALIPGVSRSGATIIAGRLSGLSPQAAAEYSFLASIPIMVGVSLKILVTDTDYLVGDLAGLLIGNLAAFVAGIAAIGFLMKYLEGHSLALFGWYRVVLSGVLVTVLLVQ